MPKLTRNRSYVSRKPLLAKTNSNVLNNIQKQHHYSDFVSRIMKICHDYPNNKYSGKAAQYHLLLKDVKNAKDLVYVCDKDPSYPELFRQIISDDIVQGYLTRPIDQISYSQVLNHSHGGYEIEFDYSNDKTGLEFLLSESYKASKKLYPKSRFVRGLKNLMLMLSNSEGRDYEYNQGMRTLMDNIVKSSKYALLLCLSTVSVGLKAKVFPENILQENDGTVHQLNTLFDIYRGKIIVTTIGVSLWVGADCGHKIQVSFQVDEDGKISRIVWANSNYDGHKSGFIMYMLPVMTMLLEMGRMTPAMELAYTRLTKCMKDINKASNVLLDMDGIQKSKEFDQCWADLAEHCVEFPFEYKTQGYDNFCMRHADRRAHSVYKFVNANKRLPNIKYINENFEIDHNDMLSIAIDDPAVFTVDKRKNIEVKPLNDILDSCFQVSNRWTTQTADYIKLLKNPSGMHKHVAEFLQKNIVTAFKKYANINLSGLVSVWTLMNARNPIIIEYDGNDEEILKQLQNIQTYATYIYKYSVASGLVAGMDSPPLVELANFPHHENSGLYKDYLRFRALRNVYHYDPFLRDKTYFDAARNDTHNIIKNKKNAYMMLMQNAGMKYEEKETEHGINIQSTGSQDTINSGSMSNKYQDKHQSIGNNVNNEKNKYQAMFHNNIKNRERAKHSDTVLIRPLKSTAILASIINDNRYILQKTFER